MTKLKIIPSTQFKKDLRLAKKRGYELDRLSYVIDCLASGKALEVKYRDHSLTGRYAGLRECHITPDWLLIYQIKDDELVLLLTRTGTHSDLFY